MHWIAEWRQSNLMILNLEEEEVVERWRLHCKELPE
jgi:hypothetical protein